MTRLITHFSQQGKRVVAVKSAPHQYDLQPSAKDTFKFLEAGAPIVYLASHNELLTMRKISSAEEIFAQLEREVTSENCDFLLLEGLRNPTIPKIEVFDSRHNEAPKFPFNQLAAIVTDKPVTDLIPNLNYENIEDIAHFMEVYHE